MEPIREAEMQTQPGKRLNEESKKSGKGPLLIAGIVLAVLLAAYAGLCAYAGSLDTFYPNRHINGIDVGGLTVGQAQQRLETQLLNQAITKASPWPILPWETWATRQRIFLGTLNSGKTMIRTRAFSRKAGPIWPPSPVAGPAVPIGRTWTKPPFSKPYPV